MNERSLISKVLRNFFNTLTEDKEDYIIVNQNRIVEIEIEGIKIAIGINIENSVVKIYRLDLIGYKPIRQEDPRRFQEICRIGDLGVPRKNFLWETDFKGENWSEKAGEFSSMRKYFYVIYKISEMIDKEEKKLLELEIKKELMDQ